MEEEDLNTLNRIHDLEVHQKTPIRVLHRRSLATRVKTIHHIRANQLNPHVLLLELETQAGT
jgi:tRNA pseudouridine synthase 10